MSAESRDKPLGRRQCRVPPRRWRQHRLPRASMPLALTWVRSLSFEPELVPCDCVLILCCCDASSPHASARSLIGLVRMWSRVVVCINAYRTIPIQARPTRVWACFATVRWRLLPTIRYLLGAGIACPVAPFVWLNVVPLCDLVDCARQGNRTTPSVVSFTPNDRLIGESAVNAAVNNPKNTIFGVKRLVGRKCVP
jgi:hypothetical protein